MNENKETSENNDIKREQIIVKDNNMQIIISNTIEETKIITSK